MRLETLNAASWDTRGNLLEVFNAAGKVIDTLQFTTPQTRTTLVVRNTPDAIYGHTLTITSQPFGSSPPGVDLLPYHGA